MKQRTEVNQLKAGAVLSMVSLLLTNLIPFFYTPIVLRILGQDQYGLYGIASSFMSYLGLLNFGIGGSIVRYMVKYRAVGDIEGEERVFGLFIKIYSVIGALILVAGMILSCNLQFYDRSLTKEELDTLKTLIRLLTVNSALFLPLSPFGSIVIANEKFIFNKLVAMILDLASPFVGLALLYHGFGVIGYTINGMIYSLVIYLIYGYYVLFRLHLRPRFGKVGDGIIKEILNYSLFVFLADIVNLLYWSTDKLIIGWSLGTTATAIYNIGSSFNGYITSISTAISGVLMPRITNMAVKDTPKEEFTALFIRVGRLQFIILSFVLSAFIAFGRQFIRIWAGNDYAQSYWVALLVMIPVTIPLIQNTGLNMLYAMNKHRFRSVSYACIAVLNVILTFWWVEYWGIIGAAAATCIAYIIGHIFLMNWYYHKKIGINIPLFWKNIVKMCPVMFVCGTAAWLILDRIGIAGWSEFFVYAVIYTIVYFILAYFFMLNDYERNLIRGPVRKILCKIRKEN